MYKSLTYTVGTSDGSLPRFLQFVEYQLYVLPPTDIEVGTYLLDYTGYANPLIKRTETITLDVQPERRVFRGNRAAPSFINPPKN
jgi:hypothetical protein